MRPLTEEETTIVFEKLIKYMGGNAKRLFDRSDGTYCLRLQRKRVFYVSEALVRRASNVGREQLFSLGTCVGKLTHSNKFHLTIHFLDLLAKYAKYKPVHRQMNVLP